jgi:N-methylhydantoinase A
MPLDSGMARQAVTKIAERLGIGLVQAAYAIHTTSNHNMVGAIENITINEGIDPRESYLVCGGGATPSHIAEIAGVLGIKRFMIPKVSAALSAYGGLVCDIRFDELGACQTDSRSFAVAEVNRVFERLRRRGEAFLDRAGVAEADRAFEYSFLGRYRYQSWEIEVPFDCPRGELGAGDLPMLVAHFHQTHERIYTIKDEEDIVEFVTWKVAARGRNQIAARLNRAAIKGGSRSPKPYARRNVYVHAAGGMVEIPIYRGDALGVGSRLVGPCVIEEDTTTIFLLPGMEAEVNDQGDYTVTVTAPAAAYAAS